MGRALATWLLITAAAATPTANPREVVEAAVVRVINVLEESQRGRSNPEPAARLSQDRARLEIRRIATDLLDFTEVGRRALGRHWAARTPQEQTEFISLFTDLLERAYVGKIEAYSGEKIVYIGETVDGDYATVRCRVLTKRRNETTLDYRLHRQGAQWKVYDLLIDGVSFVATYRAEFNRIIQGYSWDELMDRLRKKRIEARTAFDRS
jgi:phospholipid transport system substrate-binding protein